MTLTEMFTICESCVYAPCLCGNDPENCVTSVTKGWDFGIGKDFVLTREEAEKALEAMKDD